MSYPGTRNIELRWKNWASESCYVCRPVKGENTSCCSQSNQKGYRTQVRWLPGPAKLYL